MSLTIVGGVKNRSSSNSSSSIVVGSEKRRTDPWRVSSENSRKIYKVGDHITCTRVGHYTDIKDVAEEVANQCRGMNVRDTACKLQDAILDKYRTAPGFFDHIVTHSVFHDPRAMFTMTSTEFTYPKDGRPRIKIEYEHGLEVEVIIGGEKERGIVEKDIEPFEIGRLIIAGYDAGDPIPKFYFGDLAGKVEPIADFDDSGCGIVASGYPFVYNKLVGFAPGTTFNTKRYPLLSDPNVVKQMLDALRFKFDWKKITQEQMISFIEQVIKISALMENMAVRKQYELVAGINDKVEIATIDPHNGFQWVKKYDE